MTRMTCPCCQICREQIRALAKVGFIFPGKQYCLPYHFNCLIHIVLAWYANSTVCLLMQWHSSLVSNLLALLTSLLYITEYRRVAAINSEAKAPRRKYIFQNRQPALPKIKRADKLLQHDAIMTALGQTCCAKRQCTKDFTENDVSNIRR